MSQLCLRNFLFDYIHNSQISFFHFLIQIAKPHPLDVQKHYAVQNSEVHPEAEILPNGTKYNYKILEDKQTKEKRFYAYYSKEDIDKLIKNLFDIVEYHNEGGKEQKNWHVLALRKAKIS